MDAGSVGNQAVRIGPIIYTILNLISPGFYFFTQMDRRMDLINMPNQNNNDMFDFIIVGAGSTGSSLASRLSEHFSVLVLEAGGTPSPIHSIPTYAFAQSNDPSIDWGHKTTRQKQACFGLTNNTSIWPGGKLLGGSSLLNAMIYLRGNVQGFDEIAEKTGDARWKTKNVLRYYKALENYHGWFQDEHGIGGPMRVEKPITSQFTDSMMRAGEELGYKVRDPNGNGPYTEGFAKIDLYLDRGRRSDAYTEFLRPAMRRNKNLVVRKYSRVTRLLIHEDINEVYGVEYFRHGQFYKAMARREVILSAGAIRTPQILMLSGIGPKKHLQNLGIGTVMNLPVGQYLQDKYGALIGPFLVNERKSTVIDRDINLPTIINWFTSGEGPMRSSLSEGSWSINTDIAKRTGRTKKPDIHTYIVTTSMPEELEDVVTRAFNFKHAIFHHFAKAAKVDSFFQLVTLNAPLGKGRLLLRDADPFSQPIIDPKYLENDIDTMALLEGVKMAVKLVENTTAMNEINGRLMPGHLPGCEEFEFKSDSYYECLIRHVTMTAFKFSGTAPIGKGLSDPDAVVDSHLRVIGMERLRVIDASVLQQKHSSINDVTCRTLGQLATDIILEEWQNAN